MKMNISKALIWTVAATLPLAWCPFAQSAQKAAANPAEHAMGKLAVFVVPQSPKEGCDPFYPTSNRPYEQFAPPTKKTFEATELVLRGISGNTDHRLVIINNHTFGEGDEGEVMTSVGRVQLRCIAIGPNSATVEVNGQRHELIFSDK